MIAVVKVSREKDCREALYLCDRLRDDIQLETSSTVQYSTFVLLIVGVVGVVTIVGLDDALVLVVGMALGVLLGAGIGRLGTALGTGALQVTVLRTSAGLDVAIARLGGCMDCNFFKTSLAEGRNLGSWDQHC